MQYLEGNDRDQMFMLSLEEAVDKEAFVRIVDAFADAIDFRSFGFVNTDCKEEGRPAYHPSVLMKLYLYGYRFGINTSRKLEREAATNIEVMWLLRGLRPRYKTIADFRKNNSKAFREVFRKFVLLLKEWDLIEGKTVAIDSFKIRASNSLKNNFNDKKLKQHLEYIDEQIAEYEAELDLCEEEEEEEKQRLEAKISERKEKLEHYQEIKIKLEESGEQQISMTDPDSRSVVLHRKIINVGYNIQSVSDEKHKLLVDYDTGTVNDTHSLAPMAIQAKELLGVDELTVIADKGYHTGKQLEACDQNAITTFVSPRDLGVPQDSGIPLELFHYNRANDTYTCPEGHTMTTNGTWYKKSNSHEGRDDAHRFKRYQTPGCKSCRIMKSCTKNSKGRFIERSEYADIVEANNGRVNEHPDYYRKRQQITEHQFGTMKRQMGYTHTNIRGKPKVMGEIGLMFTVYDLVRCVHILGVDNFVKALKQRFCVKIDQKYGQILVVLRNLLFLLQQTTSEMNTCRMSYNEAGRSVNRLRFGIGEGCCTDSRWQQYKTATLNQTFYHYSKRNPMQVRIIIFGIIISALLTSCNMQNEQAKQGKNIEQKANQISDPDLFIGKHKAKAMVLGVFHFANPGLDSYKPKFAFNILEEKRQEELEILLRKIAEYQPTKILLEWDRIQMDSIANERYLEYLNGTFSIDDKSNEVYQIGFKLAKKLGHRKIYCSDASADWFGVELDWDNYDAELYLKSKGQYEKSTRYDFQSFYELSDSLKTIQTLTEHFAMLNSPKNRLKDHQAYLTETILEGAGDNYLGADAVANWYRRNLRVFANTYDLTDFESEERLLLIYGGGHVWQLRQLFIDSPDFEYVEPNNYLTK